LLILALPLNAVQLPAEKKEKVKEKVKEQTAEMASSRFRH
jgi:hypothetical protein